MPWHRFLPLVALLAVTACQGAAGTPEEARASDAAPDSSDIGPGDVSDQPGEPDAEEFEEPADPPDASDPIYPGDPSEQADASTDGPKDAATDTATPPKPPELRPGCTATATIGGYPAWMFFTRPASPCTGVAGSGSDSHILNELIRLIGSVPAGGRIDGHIFSITVDGVAKALLDAQTRGVSVWLSTDKGVGASTDSAKTSYLDKLVHKVYCNATNSSACIGNADGAISHTKLFVFDSAVTPDGKTAKNVVWFGSANQTYASGMNLTNNTVTVFGDPTLYSRLRAYLDDLYFQRRSGNYYDPSSGRGHILAAAADVYVSPELETDLVVNRLDDVTVDSTCEVRVLQASVRDSRMDVVNRLITMKKGGCRVWVTAHTVEPSALAALKGAGIPVRTTDVHDKVFIVKAKFGTAEQYRVYTGSHNLSISANRKYDEIFVKLAPETATAHPVYDAFIAHFNDAYGVGKVL